ncbi:MAG: hypothetical protein R2714_16670 [Microthrixaceae bacterium]
MSSARSAASYIQPMLRCWYFRNRASRASHRPVSSWTLAETMAWSALRVDRSGRVLAEHRRRDPERVDLEHAVGPRRVTAPWRSNQASAASTAASCEASTSARTNGSGDSAHRTDTDFDAENVASNPRADESPKRRPSRAPVSG